MKFALLKFNCIFSVYIIISKKGWGNSYDGNRCIFALQEYYITNNIYSEYTKMLITDEINNIPTYQCLHNWTILSNKRECLRASRHTISCVLYSLFSRTTNHWIVYHSYVFRWFVNVWKCYCIQIYSPVPLLWKKRLFLQKYFKPKKNK